MVNRFYTAGMNTSIELTDGHWLLVMGPASITPTLLKMILRLAEAGPVRVIEGWALEYSPIMQWQARRVKQEILDRVRVSSANSCRDLLDILDCLPASPEPFIVLNLLAMFSDPFLWVGERRKILERCLWNLDRL